MISEYKVLARIGFLFVMMYMIGAGLAGGVNAWKETSAVVHETKDWGLGFGENGQKPTGNTSAQELKEQDAYYVGNPGCIEETSGFSYIFCRGQLSGYKPGACKANGNRRAYGRKSFLASS